MLEISSCRRGYLFTHNDLISWSGRIAQSSATFAWPMNGNNTKGSHHRSHELIATYATRLLIIPIRLVSESASRCMSKGSRTNLASTQTSSLLVPPMETSSASTSPRKSRRFSGAPISSRIRLHKFSMLSKLVLSAICTVMRFRRPLLRETLSTHMLLRLMLGTCVGLFEPIFWKTKHSSEIFSTATSWPSIITRSPTSKGCFTKIMKIHEPRNSCTVPEIAKETAAS